MQISWKNVFLLAALLFALPLTGTPAQAAGLFGGTQAGDSVFVGEVQSYGDYELKADACATFVDKLAEALRQQGIAVSGRADLTNEEGRHDAIGSGDEAAELSEIHMDAIVHGHQFDVKYTYEALARCAAARGADAALFGHTHLPDLVQIGGVTLFTPGSAALPRNSRPTYGRITVEQGKATVFEHLEMPDYE